MKKKKVIKDKIVCLTQKEFAGIILKLLQRIDKLCLEIIKELK